MLGSSQTNTCKLLQYDLTYKALIFSWMHVGQIRMTMWMWRMGRRMFAIHAVSSFEQLFWERRVLQETLLHIWTQRYTHYLFLSLQFFQIRLNMRYECTDWPFLGYIHIYIYICSINSSCWFIAQKIIFINCHPLMMTKGLSFFKDPEKEVTIKNDEFLRPRKTMKPALIGQPARRSPCINSL